MFVGPLEPEPLEKKIPGAGAAWEKNQEPKPLEKSREPEPELLKNLPAPKPWFFKYTVVFIFYT